MKRTTIFLTALILITALTACSEKTQDSSVSISDTNDKNISNSVDSCVSSNVEEDSDNKEEMRKDIFMSYFDHNINYIIGNYYYKNGHFVTDKNDHNIKVEFLINDFLPVGSLSADGIFYDKEEILLFYTKGTDGKNYVKTRIPTADVAGDSLEYIKNFKDIIKESLNNSKNLTVLTIEEAMSTFFAQTEYNSDDYQLSVNVNGDIYYQSKKDKISFYPYVAFEMNPKFKEMIDENGIDIEDATTYYFTIDNNATAFGTSIGYYKIYLNGKLEFVPPIS
ncbi:MAG: hypothetical protein RR827_00350 [Oscillospiraceae bacterium]